MPEILFKIRISEAEENATNPNCKLVGDFVLELRADKSTIASNNILNVLGCAGEILPEVFTAKKKYEI